MARTLGLRCHVSPWIDLPVTAFPAFAGMTKLVLRRSRNSQKTAQVHTQIDLFLVGLSSRKVTLKSHLKRVRDATALVDSLADCKPLQPLGG